MLLICTQTYWVLNIYLAQLCCSHGTWGTKGTDTMMFMLLAMLSLAEKSQVFVSVHENRNRLIYELVSRVKSQTSISSSTALGHTGFFPPKAHSWVLSVGFCTFCSFLVDCSVPRSSHGQFWLLKPQIPCHLPKEAFLHQSRCTGSHKKHSFYFLLNICHTLMLSFNYLFV